MLRAWFGLGSAAHPPLLGRQPLPVVTITPPSLVTAGELQSPPPRMAEATKVVKPESRAPVCRSKAYTLPAMMGLSPSFEIPMYTRRSYTTGESYPICSLFVAEARTGDRHTNAPVDALTAHTWPLPLESGAPKMTTLTDFLRNQNHLTLTLAIVAVEAIPGLE